MRRLLPRISVSAAAVRVVAAGPHRVEWLSAAELHLGVSCYMRSIYGE